MAKASPRLRGAGVTVPLIVKEGLAPPTVESRPARSHETTASRARATGEQTKRSAVRGVAAGFGCLVMVCSHLCLNLTRLLIVVSSGALEDFEVFSGGQRQGRAACRVVRLSFASASRCVGH